MRRFALVFFVPLEEDRLYLFLQPAWGTSYCFSFYARPCPGWNATSFLSPQTFFVHVLIKELKFEEGVGGGSERFRVQESTSNSLAA